MYQRRPLIQRHPLHVFHSQRRSQISSSLDRIMEVLPFSTRKEVLPLASSSQSRQQSSRSHIMIQSTMFTGAQVRLELNAFQFPQMDASSGGTWRCLEMDQLTNSFSRKNSRLRERKCRRCWERLASSIMESTARSSSSSELSKDTAYRRTREARRFKRRFASELSLESIMDQSMHVNVIQFIKSTSWPSETGQLGSGVKNCNLTQSCKLDITILTCLMDAGHPRALVSSSSQGLMASSMSGTSSIARTKLLTLRK